MESFKYLTHNNKHTVALGQVVISIYICDVHNTSYFSKQASSTGKKQLKVVFYSDSFQWEQASCLSTSVILVQSNIMSSLTLLSDTFHGSKCRFCQFTKEAGKCNPIASRNIHKVWWYDLWCKSILDIYFHVNNLPIPSLPLTFKVTQLNIHPQNPRVNLPSSVPRVYMQVCYRWNYQYCCLPLFMVMVLLW